MFPWAKPYFNETLTPFFENSVIAELVPRSEAKKIAVCSWALRDKMRSFNVPPRIELTYEHLEQDFDILVFTRNTKAHQMLDFLDAHHKGCKDLLKRICASIGVQWSKDLKYPIYQNAFCATSDVYNTYVEEALTPAMWAMETEFKEECWKDSNYYRLKDPGDVFAGRVKHFLGVDYCPLHPFLLERLFSVWINNQGLNVKYL